MAKYTDEQTLEALRHCQTLDCVGCGRIDDARNSAVCLNRMIGNTLDLVNRLKAEKAELQHEIASYKTKIEALKDRNTTLEKMYMSCLPTPQTATERLKKYQAERARDEHLRELYAEIERLKEIINEMAINDAKIGRALKQLKYEAIKEYKSRVENDIITLLGKSNCVEFLEVLDYACKETVGEGE